MSTIYCPADGEPITEIKTDSAEEVSSAVKRGREAQRKWRKLPYAKKKRLFQRVVSLIGEREGPLVEAVARCTGKTRVDALSTEVLPAAVAARYYPKAARRFQRPQKQRRSSFLFFNKSAYLHHEPYGVVGIISPWNYPFGIPFHEVVQALSVGNAVILKVATQAQRVGEALEALFHDAGFDPALLQLLHLPGSKAGDAFFDAGIDKLFFTGSVEVGKKLMRRASQDLTPISLELGGNDGMIVCGDANLQRAAAGAAWAGISNSGQSCGGVERIYVVEEVYDRFLELLRKEVSSLRQGNDTWWDGGPVLTDFGSLSTKSQKETVERQLAEALELGARKSAASADVDSPRSGRGLFHPAVVLEETDATMAVMRDETFGPLLAVVKAATEEDAVRMANDSYLGLTGSVWSMDKRRALSLAESVEAGAVTLNDHLMSHGMPECPWGGYKQSGIGRSHGLPGFEEMTRSKVVVTESLPRLKKNIWWYPHNDVVLHGLSGALRMLATRNPWTKLKGALEVARLYIMKMNRGAT